MNFNFHKNDQQLYGNYLIMKSAATFLTLGHRMRAMIVSRLPNIPASIIIIVTTAANVSNGRENLKREMK